MSFKLRGTAVTLSYTLLCLAAVCAVLGIFQGFLWCVFAVLLHECGHLAAMRHYGYFPERIKISLFEIAITDGLRHSRSVRENAWIIFFGPFANYVCFFSGFLLYLCGIELLLPFAAANLSVGLLNSLPALTLDGGQLLYLFLCRHHSARTAARAVDIATMICVLPLAVLGFLILLRTKNNFSLLFICGYLVMSLLCRKENI